MHKHGAALFTLGLACWFLTACSLPLYTTNMTPTVTLKPKQAAQTAAAAIATAVTSLPTAVITPSTSIVTATPQPQLVVTQAASSNFCADAQVTTLINSFKSALQTSNGELLASLVSPTHGMEARLYHNGRVVTYDQAHAKFLFDSTYVVSWGAAPGSGLETKGSFHELIVPALLDVFNKNYTLTCNQVKVGGASYPTTWPYSGISFYSAYYPGSQGNGSLDWHTWLLGMQYVNGKPYLYAIMQFQWEP
jgi:hypothetical protein